MFVSYKKNMLIKYKINLLIKTLIYVFILNTSNNLMYNYLLVNRSFVLLCVVTCINITTHHIFLVTHVGTSSGRRDRNQGSESVFSLINQRRILWFCKRSRYNSLLENYVLICSVLYM